MKGGKEYCFQGTRFVRSCDGRPLPLGARIAATLLSKIIPFLLMQELAKRVLTMQVETIIFLTLREAAERVLKNGGEPSFVLLRESPENNTPYPLSSLPTFPHSSQPC